MQKDLEALDGVSKVVSILDVPLLNSPAIRLDQLAESVRTLRTADVDKTLAQRELSESTLYRELLLSADRDVTVLLAYLKSESSLEDLRQKRHRLRALRHAGTLDDRQATELKNIESEWHERQAEHTAHLRQHVAAIRHIITEYRDRGEIFLGGVPMIVADMIRFIETDLTMFGSAIFVFLVVTLTIIFRQPRWVLLPMLCCSATAVATLGLLGMLKWNITVISANFVALLLIITMSMTIHLVVRYREMQTQNAAQPVHERVEETMQFMLKPCLYAVLTTAAAFVSLIVSNIRPVIDFGYMMTLGISCAFVLTFIIFPGVLLLLAPGHSPQEKDFTSRLTTACARIACQRYCAVMVVAGVILFASIAGIFQLNVEKSLY